MASNVAALPISYTLNDELICPNLLKIVFPGADPNYLNGFGRLLQPRVFRVLCQADVLLGSKSGRVAFNAADGS